MRLLSDKSGFGKVYEAFERSVPKILKILKDNYSDNDKAVELFQQEALVLSQLHHPGIPAIEPDGYFQYKPRQTGDVLHCIVMEKIDGPNLREWMRQQGNHAIGEKQGRQWLHQLAEILHLVHQRHYFHRDIKPENIMLRSSGQVVLVDFGAAREVTYTYLAQLGKTGGITRISSAGYTPPEQEKGQAVPQSDFYALGCTFIYLLTGKQPTDSGMYDSLNNEFHWRQFAPQVTPAFADLIDRMIAPKASDRPKDTRALLDALEQLDQVPLKPTNATLIQSTGLQPIVLSTASGTASLGLMQGSDHVAVPPRQESLKRWIWSGAIALLLALGGYGVWQAVGRQHSSVVTQAITADRTLAGHTSYVNTEIIAPDGKTLISGGADNTIRIWDITTGRLTRTLSGHTSFVNALTLTPDGNTLISGSADRTIKIWDLTTGKLTHTLLSHQGFVNALDVSPDGAVLASGSADHTVKIWDLATAKLIRTLTGHTGFVNSVVFSPDGKTLISGSADFTLKVWDIATGTLKQTLTGHKGFVNEVAITPDGSMAISSSADKTIRLWDLSNGKTVRTLSGTSFFDPLWISPDGQTLISGSTDGKVQVWNIASGKLLQTLTGYKGDLQHFAIGFNGQTLISGSGSHDIKIWKLPQPAAP